MFATGKIQNGMDLYVADPEVTTEHKPNVDSEPYRVTQENLMEKWQRTSTISPCGR